MESQERTGKFLWQRPWIHVCLANPGIQCFRYLMSFCQGHAPNGINAEEFFSINRLSGKF